jgi:RNA polymerase sigma-70 factor (ECF subfamily)
MFREQVVKEQHFVAIRNGSTALTQPPVQAFCKLAEIHRPRIFRFLLASSRDPDLADTLTQECFLKAHRNWLSFRNESSTLTWLMRIAINVQKDHWRSRRIQFWRAVTTNSVDPLHASEWLPGSENSPEDRTAAREQVKLVWKAADNLSSRQRTVFLLRFVEELKISEIAQTVGLTEGAVKSHLARAVHNVRVALKEG